jgi:cell division transport system permease protein
VFVIRETFRLIRHSPLLWSMSVLTLAVALGVSGLIGLIAWKAHQSLHELQHNLAIEAFFDPSIPSDEATSRANSEVPKISGISSFTVISKEEALETYRRSSGENVESVLGLNPLPASIKVYLIDPSSASASRVELALKSISGIEAVRSDEELLRRTESRAHALNKIAIIVGALLLISAMLFVGNSARLLMGMREKNIKSLALMGATRWQINGPFVLEGALSGIFGGLVATGIVLLISKQEFFAFGGAIAIPSNEIITILCILTITGFLIAVFSTLAVSFTRRRPL